MSDQKSQMVLAEKYELEVKLKGKEGYQIDGQKRLLHEKKLVPRQWAEDRNEHPNNEYYVVFEEETAELMKQREANIQENAEKESRKNVTMADLVDVVANGGKPVKAKILEAVPDVSKEELSKKDAEIEELKRKLAEKESEGKRPEPSEEKRPEPSEEKRPEPSEEKTERVPDEKPKETENESSDDKPSIEWEEERLREYCAEKGYKFHHKAGAEKLMEVITENEKS